MPLSGIVWLMEFLLLITLPSLLKRQSTQWRLHAIGVLIQNNFVTSKNRVTAESIQMFQPMRSSQQSLSSDC